MSTEELIIYMAEYHNKQISEPVVRMYAADLKILTVKEINEAWVVYRNKPENKFMPQPSQLKAIARPEFDTVNVPKILTETLYCEISSKGPNWLRNNDREEWPGILKCEFGGLGYKVIMYYGGWSKFCNNFDMASSQENAKAQLRNMIKAVMELSLSGNLDKKFQAPTIENQNKNLPLQIGN